MPNDIHVQITDRKKAFMKLNTSVAERIIFSCAFCFTAKLSRKIYIQLCVRFTDKSNRRIYIQLCVRLTVKSPRDLRFKNAFSDARV